MNIRDIIKRVNSNKIKDILSINNINNKTTPSNIFIKNFQYEYSSTSFQKVTSFRDRRPQRQLKPFQKLFYSSPVMNINIQMILAINQLRPKATYIIATKNGQIPGLLVNSTYNIIECLNYIQGFKFFYKSFPALTENITKVLNDEKIDFYMTGMYKSNAIKKLVYILNHVDSVNGEIFVQMSNVFIISSLEASIKIKKQLDEIINPLKEKLKIVQSKIQQFNQLLKNINKKLENSILQINQRIQNFKKQKALIQKQIKSTIYNKKFMKEEDFLCGLHYCLQKGYYTQNLLKYFYQNILSKNDYNFPQFSQFLQQQRQFFSDKPLINIENRRGIVYSRMYNNIVYRLKILNQLKKMKQFDPLFGQFLKNKQYNDNQPQNQSSSDESPFIGGEKIDFSSQTSELTQQNMFMTESLIEESFISKDKYMKMVNKYLEFFQRKDIMSFILTEEATSQSLKVMVSDFYSWVKSQNIQNTNNQNNNKLSSLGKQSSNITLNQIKSRYLSLFKQIYNIQKNGSSFIQSGSHIQCIFEIILKMYDYSDRKQIFQLLRLYEKSHLTKNMTEIRTMAPFYVCEKYHYKSNFLASKLFQHINFKYRLGRQQYIIKQQMLLLSNQICKTISLYFKLLQNNIQKLYSNADMQNNIIKNKNNLKISNSNDKLKINSNSNSNGNNNINNNKISQQKQNLQGLSDQINNSLNMNNQKYQQEFQQAVEIFLNNYHKIISVLYLETQNISFIGKGPELYFDFLKAKYFNTKTYEGNITVDNKLPEEDIRKIIIESSEGIKKHRLYVKNVYQKEFIIENNTNNNNSKLSKNDNNKQSINGNSSKLKGKIDLKSTTNIQSKNSTTKVNSKQKETKSKSPHKKQTINTQQANSNTNASEPSLQSIPFRSLNFNQFSQTMFIKCNASINPIDQLINILQITQTAIQLQSAKNVQFYQDVLVIFKSIFSNKKFTKILSNCITYPDLLKRFIRISQLFKGSYKNESNKLFESILNLTDFNMNSFLHNARISIAREILNAQKPLYIEEKFQPYLYSLELNNKYDKNCKIWQNTEYNIVKKNVLANIRSDILYTALIQNAQLQKIIRDELAKIKTIKPTEKIKNMKFQLNYLQYPYLANVAINKNNQLIVLLVRKSYNQQQKSYNQVLDHYNCQSEEYFRKKGNKVIIASNQHQIRNSLRELIK